MTRDQQEAIPLGGQLYYRRPPLGITQQKMELRWSIWAETLLTTQKGERNTLTWPPLTLQSSAKASHWLNPAGNIYIFPYIHMYTHTYIYVIQAQTTE